MERRLAAILAADVVGYSRLMGADETGTLERLKSLREELVQPSIENRKGRIVKLMGDGVLAEFPSVVEATQCAIDIQGQMDGRETDVPEERRIRLRIGINLGDVIGEGGDVYGEGVNIAARLEGLADPGGICVSDMVHQGVETKLDAPFESMGKQSLKNIDRPIVAWRWAPDSASPSSSETSDVPFERPSIAVLPFNNMSGDPEQEYFSDGISEDIITELSRFRELFVIARNSSFSYKGKSIKVQEIGRDLGVAFIVEGSVRKAGSRVRVTAQLIEAETGNHIWADKYDRELEDIFDLQDDITQTIVALLPIRLKDALVESVRRKPSQSLSAYDCYLHGRWLFDQTAGQDPKALELLTKAIGIDPNFALAHCYIALAHAYSLYTTTPIGADPIATALESAERALAAGEGDHFVHSTMGSVYILCGRHELADMHSQKAITLNPNDIFALMARGYVLAYLGDPEAGVSLLARALRHDPNTSSFHYEMLAEACYLLRDYERAVQIYERWRNRPVHSYVLLAVNLAQLERMDEAQAAMEAYEGHSPPDFVFIGETHARMCRRADDAEHWREGYRKVGIEI